MSYDLRACTTAGSTTAWSLSFLCVCAAPACRSDDLPAEDCASTCARTSLTLIQGAVSAVLSDGETWIFGFVNVCGIRAIADCLCCGIGFLKLSLGGNGFREPRQQGRRGDRCDVEEQKVAPARVYTFHLIALFNGGRKLRDASKNSPSGTETAARLRDVSQEPFGASIILNAFAIGRLPDSPLMFAESALTPLAVVSLMPKHASHPFVSR